MKKHILYLQKSDAYTFFMYCKYVTPLGAGKSKDLCWKGQFPRAYLN